MFTFLLVFCLCAGGEGEDNITLEFHQQSGRTHVLYMMEGKGLRS